MFDVGRQAAENPGEASAGRDGKWTFTLYRLPWRKDCMMGFNGLGMNMGNLSLLSDAKTRSICPENFTGDKGAGAMATEGAGASCARDLGRGWKMSPSVRLYYQVNYTLTDVPEDAAYFHAQFRRVNPLPYKGVYTILDGRERVRALRGHIHGLGRQLRRLVG